MAYLKVEIVCGFEGQIDMDYRMFEFIGHLFCLPWEGHDWGVHCLNGFTNQLHLRGVFIDGYFIIVWECCVNLERMLGIYQVCML